MTTLFEHTTVYPSQRSCHGGMCYCFYGTNPLNTPTDDDEDDTNYYDDISDVSSVTLVAEEDDLPQIVREVIEPFLEPVALPPQNTHLYFDDDGNTISKEQYDMNIKQQENEERAKNWAFRVNNITFRHPRALLAYFRMVDLVNEVAEDDEKIRIPSISEPMRLSLLNHPSFTDTPAEFTNDVLELMAYIFRYSL